MEKTVTGAEEVPVVLKDEPRMTKGNLEDNNYRRLASKLIRDHPFAKAVKVL